jgi:hypothetical protein
MVSNEKSLNYKVVNFLKNYNFHIIFNLCLNIKLRFFENVLSLMPCETLVESAAILLQYRAAGIALNNFKWRQGPTAL